MAIKKGFNVYHLLASEGSTEFNLFAYLTKNKYRTLFEESKIKFSLKIEIPTLGISQGKLDGVSSLKDFQSKYSPIKKKYKDQKRFFFLDKDLKDSPAIEKLIMENGDYIQFVEYNSEHLLLNLAGKKPKNPDDFKSMSSFRAYCKLEFKSQFGKKASDFKDVDFGSIFDKIGDKKIKENFTVLFSTLRKH
jgi:hypothetical protein